MAKSKFTLKRLTARRVARHRRWIGQNRCAVRPGLTHQWATDAVFDPTSLGSVIEFWTCTKCGQEDGL